MNILFAFSIAAFVPLFFMWLSYRFVLSRRRLPVVNRAFLISGSMAIIVSLMLVRLSPLAEPDNVSLPDAVGTAVHQTESTAALVGDISEIADVGPYLMMSSEGDRIWSILFMVYCVGMALVLVALIVSLIRIALLIRKAHTVTCEGKKVYVVERTKISPFSLGSIIVINRHDYECNGRMIVAHEMGHMKHRHTVDMIMSHILIVTCWYNPAVWLIRKELKMSHEYQADDFVLSKGYDSYEYQMLLISMAAHGRFPSIGNNLNYNNLKNRLKMMNSKKVSRFQYLLVSIPAFTLVAAIMFSCGNSVQNAADKAETASVAADTVAQADTNEYNVFLIRGVDMDSKAITDGDFIWMGDLAYTDRPDSSFEGFTLPITKSVITSHKDVIEKLAPNADSYVIDGENATKAQFDTLEAKRIQRVDIDGNKLVIETRYGLDEPNPDVKMAVDEESRLYRRSMKKQD